MNWEAVGESLDAQGWAVLPGLVAEKDCAALKTLYADAARFRSRIVMARHGFGKGEYQYFAYPLPPLVETLRTMLYPPLAQIANRWQAAMEMDFRFPETHADYLAHCHAAGQTRPTPLLLSYQAGDYNCLHQDLYGAETFPLQATILLSDPGTDFSSGEFVMTEQRPRMQSKVAVIPLKLGDAVVFAVNQRPVKGTRGIYRVRHRHGVSMVTEGKRMTMGLIFHDAA